MTPTSLKRSECSFWFTMETTFWTEKRLASQQVIRFTESSLVVATRASARSIPASSRMDLSVALPVMASTSACSSISLQRCSSRSMITTLFPRSTASRVRLLPIPPSPTTMMYMV